MVPTSIVVPVSRPAASYYPICFVWNGGSLWICHEKYNKDDKLLVHLGFMSNVLPGSLTDWSGNTFDLNPKWVRTLPSLIYFSWDIYRDPPFPQKNQFIYQSWYLTPCCGIEVQKPTIRWGLKMLMKPVVSHTLRVWYHDFDCMDSPQTIVADDMYYNNGITSKIIYYKTKMNPDEWNIIW
jgi:hypothetical protein